MERIGPTKSREETKLGFNQNRFGRKKENLYTACYRASLVVVVYLNDTLLELYDLALVTCPPPKDIEMNSPSSRCSARSRRAPWPGLSVRVGIL